MPPILYIKDTMHLANEGLGDGTVYATGTVGVGDIDQSARTFTLSGLSLIADIGADADDKFNSHILYFPASGNKYHIVDWEAGIDRATTWETPMLEDTGTCEIRRALVENGALASNPIHFASDGQLYSEWKSGTGINSVLDISLPNFVGDGGFESLAVGGFPATDPGSGAWYYEQDNNISVVFTSALLGQRMAVWSKGSGSQITHLKQTITSKFKKGRKYRVAFKALAIDGNTDPQCARVFLRANDLGSEGALDNDWGGSSERFDVQPTTSAQWFSSPDLVPDFDSDRTTLTIEFVDANAGAANFVRIDEIYLWEIVDPRSLVIFGHNLHGQPGLTVYGDYCTSGRTGFTGADQIVMLSTPAIVGTETYLADLSTPAIRPIYRVSFSASAGHAYSASQILLCEKWEWEKGPNRPFGLETSEKKQNVFTSKAGVQYKSIDFTSRHFTNTLPLMSETDRSKLKNDFKPYHWDTNHPFGVQVQTGDPVLLMTDETTAYDPVYRQIKPDWAFNFKEVK